MTFEIENFKEVGGIGNSKVGGQLYSVFSETDSLAQMRSDGYLNELSNTLNKMDFIFLSGADGSVMVQVSSVTSGVVTINDFFGGVQVHTQTSTADKTSRVHVFKTGGSAATLTVKDGSFEGQRKMFVFSTKGGGNAFVKPDKYPHSGTQFEMNAVLDVVDMVWTDALGWMAVSTRGVTIT